MARQATKIHLLDVGEEEYGDAVLCEFGKTRVLIDGAHPGNQVSTGGHPSIPQQLQTLLGAQATPVNVDLLVVTHAHADHIGCLPFLVQHGLVSAKWALVCDPGLGWGRALDHDARPAPAGARVANLVAAVREEVRSERTDDRALAQFLADAAGLESGYNQMLEKLAADGTRVVRHGRDKPAALLKAFKGIGLKIVGPSQAHLLVCAAAIAKRSDDAAAYIDAHLPRIDAAVPETELYRAFMAPAHDEADAISRPGPPINLQSIVTSFQLGDVKVLFAGDMQFADPQLADPVLQRELRALRKAIGAGAPYSFVKLSHHGSDNAFDTSVLEELKTTSLFGICAGEQSTHHPNPQVLKLLNAERDRLTWVRTDRNGLTTLELNGKPKLSLAEGQVNDPRPNMVDTGPVVAPPGPAGGPEVRVTSEGKAAGAAHDPVEVITRVPSGVERVTVTIDVDEVGHAASPHGAPDQAGVTLAGGRTLPPLLFVTSAEGLVANVGRREAAQVLAAIRATGARLYDGLAAGATDPAAALAAVRERMAAEPDLRGVVLVGGYDVVPAQRLDALPPPVREKVGHTDDADDFIVWSDDGYGDRDGDRIAELPVSRIPDGKSAELLLAALGARDAPRDIARSGVRNVARPFAEPVFAALPGDEALSVSHPTTFDEAPALDGDLVYLMLHGDYVDSSRFWGEDTANDREAVNLTNIPTPGGRVVFTGCCWGALTVDQPALRAVPGTPPPPKAAASSMALSFLERGATAFVGCTGSHYSPTEKPYGYFGGPMHDAFWKALLGGSPPAPALFEAKQEYVAGFPHGRTSPLQEAIEYKILGQYTCLGLGW